MALIERQVEDIEQQLRERAVAQPKRHLVHLYCYAADALRTARHQRLEVDRVQGVEAVAHGLALAVRGSPEAADIANLPMLLVAATEG
jgi:hypothetical protein